MSEYGLVESILASVQWDRWKFMLSAKKLCKQDVAVVSHSHLDHWATNLVQKDVVMVPAEVTVPRQLLNARNILRVSYSAKVRPLHLIKLGAREIAAFVRNESIRHVHASWWIIDSQKTRVLFIGDLDAPDVGAVRAFVGRAYEQDLKVQGTILPSYGGVSTHRAREPTQLSETVTKLAYALHDVYRIRMAALPHPIEAEWADYNAQALQIML
jgi:hypothetical protein